VHENVKPFSCTFCSNQFRQKAHLNRHLITHQKKDNLTDQKDNFPAPTVAKIGNGIFESVKECGKYFSDLKKLMHHHSRVQENQRTGITNQLKLNPELGKGGALLAENDPGYQHNAKSKYADSNNEIKPVKKKKKLRKHKSAIVQISNREFKLWMFCSQCKAFLPGIQELMKHQEESHSVKNTVNPQQIKPTEISTASVYHKETDFSPLEDKAERPEEHHEMEDTNPLEDEMRDIKQEPLDSNSLEIEASPSSRNSKQESGQDQRNLQVVDQEIIPDQQHLLGLQHLQDQQLVSEREQPGSICCEKCGASCHSEYDLIKHLYESHIFLKQNK